MRFHNLKRRFLENFINITTSGKYTEKNEFGLSDYLIRYALMNFIIIIGTFILAAFAIVNYRKEWFFTSYACFYMIIVCLIIFTLARTRIRQIIPSIILVISYCVFCVAITWPGEAEGANFLFIYMVPSVAVMLLGMNIGIMVSVVLLVFISIEMFFPKMTPFDYHFDFSIRMLVNYLLVLSSMIVIETSRKTKDRIVEAQRKTLETLSTTDELTKLHNRRSFWDYIDIVWKQNHRLHLPVAILMIDVDYFKRYNDSMGHLEGDKTLIAIAQCMRNQLRRDTDFIARFGGEEFICLLPYITKPDAVHFAHDLRQSVEKMKIPHPKSDCSQFITISVGVASFLPDDDNSYKLLLDEADKALYTAKQSGRNKVSAS